jgi:hypothetical protein
MKFLVRIAATLLLGAGTAYAAPHLPFLAANSNGNGCAVGRHSRPVGDHSKPCPTPHGCAIGHGGPVGDHSKPCPTPHGCAIGNARFVGNRAKGCPTPHGHHHHSSSGHGHKPLGTLRPHSRAPKQTHGDPKHGHGTAANTTLPTSSHPRKSQPLTTSPAPPNHDSPKQTGLPPAHGHKSRRSSGAHGH